MSEMERGREIQPSDISNGKEIGNTAFCYLRFFFKEDRKYSFLLSDKNKIGNTAFCYVRLKEDGKYIFLLFNIEKEDRKDSFCYLT